jgi:hypothetical protein
MKYKFHTTQFRNNFMCSFLITTFTFKYVALIEAILIFNIHDKWWWFLLEWHCNYITRDGLNCQGRLLNWRVGRGGHLFAPKQNTGTRSTENSLVFSSTCRVTAGPDMFRHTWNNESISTQNVTEYKTFIIEHTSLISFYHPTYFHTAPCKMDTLYISWMESDWNVVLTTHPVLWVVPGLSIGRAIPAPPLCTHLACYRTAFNFDLLHAL